MLGLHLTFSTYGFWLPNDPRGSGSVRVQTQHLYEVGGEATKVSTTRSVASLPHNTALRQQTKQALKRPPVIFNGRQASAIAQGIGEISAKISLRIHAVSIMPNHVHAVVARHRLDPDELIGCLKRSGSRALNSHELYPLKNFARPNGKCPSPWAAGGWKVFLHTPADMRRAIDYVEQNPVRAGMKLQQWSFVVPFAD